MPEIRTPALRHTRGAFGAGRDDNPGKISTCNQVNRMILLSRASKKKREKERERAPFNLPLQAQDWFIYIIATWPRFKIGRAKRSITVLQRRD
jgi:hypothetical protein